MHPLYASLKPLITQAGEIALRHLNTNVEIEIKQDDSPVTKADKEVDAFLREGLQKLFPEDDILTEETWKIPPREKTMRLIDPIDGTRDFIAGGDAFSIIIGRATPEQGAVYGVIYFPVTKERVYTNAEGGVTYAKDSYEKVFTASTPRTGKVYYKKSMEMYEETKALLDKVSEHNKTKVRPSGYAMKQYILESGSVFALGHGYTYELCAFSALERALGGDVFTGDGKMLDVYTPENKIMGGCYIGREKDVARIFMR